MIAVIDLQPKCGIEIGSAAASCLGGAIAQRNPAPFTRQSDRSRQAGKPDAGDNYA